MPETVLFKSEESSTRTGAASFLRTFADKIESGRVTLKQGESETSLDIPEHLSLEVKAEREEKPGKPGKLSLEVELEWTPGAPGAGPGGVELA